MLFRHDEGMGEAKEEHVQNAAGEPFLRLRTLAMFFIVAFLFLSYLVILKYKELCMLDDELSLSATIPSKVIIHVFSPF